MDLPPNPQTYSILELFHFTDWRDTGDPEVRRHRQPAQGHGRARLHPGLVARARPLGRLLPRHLAGRRARPQGPRRLLRRPQEEAPQGVQGSRLQRHGAQARRQGKPRHLPRKVQHPNQSRIQVEKTSKSSKPSVTDSGESSDGLKKGKKKKLRDRRTSTKSGASSANDEADGAKISKKAKDPAKERKRRVSCKYLY